MPELVCHKDQLFSTQPTGLATRTFMYVYLHPLLPRLTNNFLIVFDGDIFGALYECSLTILFFTFEGVSFIKGSWISLFFGDLRLHVWCCKWDGWVGNSVGTAPSFSNLPLFPGLTMKQDSLKCTLHIKLWSFGNQCSQLTALAHCFKTGGFLCGKWKKEIFHPFSCLFVQPYTT